MRYETGERVEVLDASTGLWAPAVVIRFWLETSIPDSESGVKAVRSDFAEVEGEDDFGPFHGRFDLDHLRRVTEEVLA